MDINVNDITKQYLDYIRMMKELDLEVAGEFVAMAATLIHIKSKMLLPQYDEAGEVLEIEDPRKELVQKLLEYQRYQEVAKQLYDRPLLRRDVFPRGVREDLRDEESLGAVQIEEDGLFSLIAAYRRSVRKALRAVHNVRPRVQSIASRVLELKDRLIVGSRLILRELLNAEGPQARAQLLITFLSLLELGRMGFVSVFQSETYGDIHIETVRPIERNVLERVQEFDSSNAEAVAASIINNAIDERIDFSEAMSDDAALSIVAENTASDVEALSGGQAELALDFDSDEDSSGASTDASPDMGPEMATDEEILAAEAELDSAFLSEHSEPGTEPGGDLNNG